MIQILELLEFEIPGVTRANVTSVWLVLLQSERACRRSLMAVLVCIGMNRQLFQVLPALLNALNH